MGGRPSTEEGKTEKKKKRLLNPPVLNGMKDCEKKEEHLLYI